MGDRDLFIGNRSLSYLSKADGKSLQVGNSTESVREKVLDNRRFFG
jgi:hypothetical protein